MKFYFYRKSKFCLQTSIEIWNGRYFGLSCMRSMCCNIVELFLVSQMTYCIAVQECKLYTFLAGMEV